MISVVIAPIFMTDLYGITCQPMRHPMAPTKVHLVNEIPQGR